MIRRLRLVQLMGWFGLLSWQPVGCSADPPPTPAPYDEPTPSISSGSASETSTGTSSGGDARTVGPCTEMQVRECRIELGAQGAVRNCFVGLQLCRDGRWGPCQEPDALEAELTAD